MKLKIAALVLAAGASSRMGRPKALLPWGRVSVLEHILGEIKSSGIGQITVVAGAQSPEISQLVAGRAEICEHPEWALGMGSSIRKGISFLLRKQEPPDAILILLADQPLVTSAYLRQLLTSFEAKPDRPVASAYDNGPGVPALFPSGFFVRLEALPDDKGARSLLKGASVQVLDPGVAGQDMDTPEAYRGLLKQAGLN